jgi:glycosyltransferase involved in cell wall biosynthesis
VNDLISHPITTRFFFLAKELIEKHSVRISLLRYRKSATRSGSPYERALDAESVFFKSFDVGGVSSYYLLNCFEMGRVLAKCLKRQDVDAIIHANILPSTLAVGIGKAFGVPLVYDYQDHFPESAAAYFRDTTHRAMVYSLTSGLTRINVRYSDVVVTVTNCHKDLIRGYDSTKPVEVIPNGVDTSVFRPGTKARALKKLGMEDLLEKIIILFFGSIDPWVDFATPLQVIRRLIDAGHDILFFIVGFSHTGYYIDDIKKMARTIGVENCVRFFDAVPQDVLVNFINASDMVLVPYKLVPKNQAVPLKVLESLACGKEVIISRVPEIVERFGEVVFSYSSAKELEAGITQLLKDKDKTLDTRKQDAIRATIQKYSWNSLASKYYRLIELLVSGQNLA